MPIVSAIRWGGKDGWIYRFFPCTGSGLAGRPSCENRPTCRSQGSSRRSGRFPALPYPPLKQMGGLSVVKGCFPFPFPWGPIGGERETAGDGESSIELIASAIVGHHASLGQLSQAGANRGGAQAAELAQLLDGDGLIQAGQDLLDALESRRGSEPGSGMAGVLRSD